jgi:hypothetical protein
MRPAPSVSNHQPKPPPKASGKFSTERSLFSVIAREIGASCSIAMTSPLKSLLDSVRHAIKTENWLCGLALALTLPDLCATIEGGRKVQVLVRYSKWWNENFGETYRYGESQEEYVNGLEVYLLRCAYLRQGIDSVDPKQVDKYNRTVDKFIFIRPLSHDSSEHLKRDGISVQLDIKKFCEDICSKVTEWNQNVLNNNEAMHARALQLLKIYSMMPSNAPASGESESLFQSIQDTHILD